ncbi:hypothetical protein J2S34_002555 [Nitrobacter winogradskyi]|uniref:Uncharacterized protein n=2 Tax=Nitrobacter winogradskyi TaxID=913 RepID=A0ACC6AKM8_NITWI|nr:hypothetical protein [Nitrobacter winogradskyi]GEC15745.1 hypothetical protein NWI01_16370 [Nitrobacter winogradskyi]
MEISGRLERFQTKRTPVRVKKTRQTKIRESDSSSIRSGKTPGDIGRAVSELRGRERNRLRSAPAE